MKRNLLIFVILAAMLLSACAAPATTPEPTTTPTPTTTPDETIQTPTPTPTYTLSVSVSPSGAGSVSPPGGKYESGLQVTLTATPASGNTFDYWDGAASGSSHTVTITMNSNKSTTAHFKAIETPEAPTPTPTPDPESLKTSRANPAGLNQVIRVDVDDWLDGKIIFEIEMIEIISGEEAWEMVYAGNKFNDPPGAGKEYILAKFRVKIVELQKEPYGINHAQFGVYSATGVEYTEFFSVSGLDPDLRANLFEGAEHIGYSAFIVKTDDSPATVYMLRWDENAIWFDLRSE